MNTRHEQNILTFSACGALFFAMLALIWGVLTKSQMIMFDGIYSFISLVLTGLYFYTAKSIAAGSNKNFPFGKAQMEPMVIVVQSLILLVVCVKAFSSALISLFSGGQEINTLSGIGYAVIGVGGCFIFWYYINHSAKKKALKSGLIRTQAGQWLMDTLLSLAVLIGFLVSYVMQRAGYGQYARYMDPIMVIVAVLFFARQPIISLIEGARDMLLMAPDKGVYSASKEALKEIAERKGFDDVVLRQGKSGRELVCEVSFVSQDPDNSRSVGEMDAIHREVEEKLSNLLDSQLWLCVSFIHDRRLG